MRFLIFMTVFFTAHAMGANCPDDSRNGRKCFDNSNAPTVLVYRLFVQSVFSGSLDYLEDLDGLDDAEFYLGMHYVEAGLTPNMTAADVVRYFVTRFLDIEKESENLQKQMLCLNGKPRYEGAENFLIFNQLEEASLNVYEKYLLLARSDLQANGLFDLDKALEEFPGAFGETFMDHEKVHDGSALAIYEAALQLCKDAWGHSFSTSKSENEK